MRLLRTTLNLVLWLAVLVLAGAMALPVAFGLDRYVILTGSMRPDLPPGTLIFDKRVTSSEIKVGDVISVVPPGAPRLRTHRIIKIGRDPKTGVRTFTTKGDANKVRDPGHPIVIPKAGKVIAHLPYVGWAYVYLARFRFLLLGIPALIVGVAPLVKLWREVDEDDDPAEIEAPALALLPNFLRIDLS